LIPFTVTDEQKANLKTLADFLDTHVPPPSFDMEGFLSMKEYNYELSSFAHLATPEVYAACGTVACAVGHGPLAGIKPLENETWKSYAARVFGADLDNRPTFPLFQWLFGMGWSDTDNTPEGAVARIRDFLDTGGIPDNWAVQLRGDANLSYQI
jgi:hypothetical protein